MGKRQLATEETRRRIVAAAERLIGEKGFENVGVQDITDEAGVAKGSFYTYFRRKEDVVCEIACDKFLTVEEQARTKGDACGQITFFLTGSIKYIVDTGLPICQQWLKNVVEPEDEQGKEKLARDTEVIRGILSAAVDRGELRADTPADTLAEGIVAEYYGAVALWAITNGKAAPESILADHCAGALSAVLAGYKA